jgi:hypothetical protein
VRACVGNQAWLFNPSFGGRVPALATTPTRRRRGAKAPQRAAGWRAQGDHEAGIVGLRRAEAVRVLVLRDLYNSVIVSLSTLFYLFDGFTNTQKTLHPSCHYDNMIYKIVILKNSVFCLICRIIVVRHLHFWRLTIIGMSMVSNGT